jgi:hypothetical protein
MSQAMKMQIIQAQPNREAMAPLSRKITSCTLATQIRTCMTTFFFFFFLSLPGACFTSCVTIDRQLPASDVARNTQRRFSRRTTFEGNSVSVFCPFDGNRYTFSVAASLVRRCNQWSGQALLAERRGNLMLLITMHVCAASSLLHDGTYAVVAVNVSACLIHCARLLSSEGHGIHATATVDAELCPFTERHAYRW